MVPITSGDRELYGVWGMRQLWGMESANGYDRTVDDVDDGAVAVLGHRLNFTPTFFETDQSRWIYPYAYGYVFEICFGAYEGSDAYIEFNHELSDNPRMIRAFFVEGDNYIRYYFGGTFGSDGWDGVNAGTMQFEITFFDTGHIEVAGGDHQTSELQMELYKDGFLRQTVELYSTVDTIVLEPDTTDSYNVLWNTHAEPDAAHDIFIPDVDGTLVTRTDDSIGAMDPGWYKHIPACRIEDVDEDFLRIGTGDGSVRALPVYPNGDTGLILENPNGNVRELRTYNSIENVDGLLPDHYENAGRCGSPYQAWEWASQMDGYEDLHRFDTDDGWRDAPYAIFVVGLNDYEPCPIRNVKRIRVQFAANHIDYSTYPDGDYALGVMDANDNWSEDLKRTTPTNGNKEVIIDYTFSNPTDVLGVAIYGVGYQDDTPPVYFDYEPEDNYSRFAAECDYTYEVKRV